MRAPIVGMDMGSNAKTANKKKEESSSIDDSSSSSNAAVFKVDPKKKDNEKDTNSGKPSGSSSD